MIDSDSESKIAEAIDAYERGAKKAIAAIEAPSAIVLRRAIGIEGVWAAYPITFGAMFILQMSYYMLVWRKRTIRRLI